MLTELCAGNLILVSRYNSSEFNWLSKSPSNLGGPLISILQKHVLSPEQICKIFHNAASAVCHMHDRNPPITHRDIKVGIYFGAIENLVPKYRLQNVKCEFRLKTYCLTQMDSSSYAISGVLQRIYTDQMTIGV